MSELGLLSWDQEPAGTSYHLQFILPELLLAGLVEKGELAHMMDEDVPQDGQLRVEGGHLAVLGPEGCTESLQRGGRVELRDLPFRLLRDELALEVCRGPGVSTITLMCVLPSLDTDSAPVCP